MSKYYNVIERCEEFDVLFKFNRESWIHRVIWYFSRIKNFRKLKYKKKTAHVMFYLGNGKMAEMDWDGFQIVDVPLYKRGKYTIHAGRCLMSFNRAAMTRYVYESPRRIRRYDFLRLPLIALRKLFGLRKMVGDYSEDAMICTEFVAECFSNVDIKLCPGIESCDTTPIDLVQSELLHVFEL